MKYMGSKARIANEILLIILESRIHGQAYVEPFAGGMNSICKVDGFRIANDINYYLIEMWKELVSGWIPYKITKQNYIDIRNNKDNYIPSIVGWAGFNCSYSGKWFGGFAGEVSTKNGKIRDYQLEAINHVQKQSKLMCGVDFQSKKYNELILPPNSIIYCDPPYQGTTKYYNKFNHAEFFDWVREISKSHKVFISEYNAPKDFICIWGKEINSSLSANGIIGGNKKSLEKLFTI